MGWIVQRLLDEIARVVCHRFARRALVVLHTLPVLFASLLAAAPAGALTLRIDASSDVLLPDELITATVRLLGIGDGGQDAVGAFDIRLDWNESILAIESIAILPALGVPGDALDVVSSGDGRVRFANVSLLSPAALAGIQGDDVALVSIVLRALTPGHTMLDPSLLRVGDAWGADLELDEIISPTLRVVPEPASITLVATGLLCAAFRTRLQRR